MSGETLFVSVRTENALAFVRDRGRRLVAGLGRAILRLSIEVQRHVKEMKLSGQVLRVRTGTLRRSINRRVVYAQNAILAVVGTNVEYAAIHEYGFRGPMGVKAHLRMIKEAWGRPLRTPKRVSVSAHTRFVDLPQRSFLRTALFEMRPRIEGELQAAAREAVR